MFKFNPFRPNSIVGPGMFAGRGDEIRTLDQALFQTKNGNPFHFLIHGERGIGKSSLMYCVGLTASGKIDGLHGHKFNFLTVSIELEPSTVFPEIVRKIGSELSRVLREMETVRAAAKETWDFLKCWEVFGVKFTETSNVGDLVEELCETIINVTSRLGDSTDGILILIDEADKPDASAHLGEFIKLFTERLTKRSCNNVGIGLSGISPLVTQKLKASHESAPRILNHILLEPLLFEERLEVIKRGLLEANEKSEGEKSVTISAAASDWIAKLSEGYPHFIQQYAFSAFETNANRKIDINDAAFGAFKENGALDQLGSRFFEDMYLDQINSDEYRKVLQAMANCPSEYMVRKDIKETTGLRETTLTNALSALKKKGTIIAHREKKGLYKLPTNTFGSWIRARAKREAEQDVPK